MKKFLFMSLLLAGAVSLLTGCQVSSTLGSQTTLPTTTASIYTVSFNGGGGTLVAGSETQVISLGEYPILPSYERSGYTFTGFDHNPATISSDMLLTAQWVVNTFATTGIEFILTLEDVYQVVNYTGTDAEVIIPAIHLGKSVKYIESGAFDDLDHVTKIVIPDTIRGINVAAMYDMDGLTYLYIPKNTAVTVSSAYLCRNLENIFVDIENTRHTSVEGVVYSKDLTQLSLYPNARQGDYVVLAGTTNIWSYAFANAHGLTGVVIPEGVLGIDSNTFLNCTLLTSITLPESLIHIQGDAFHGCSSLQTFTIPKNVITIIFNPFPDCAILTDIYVDPLNTAFVSIGGVLFTADQTALSSYPGGKTGTYDVPAGTQIIMAYAFGGASVTAITFPDSLTTIRNSAFKDCSLLTDIVIPLTVTTIGTGAFINSGITTIYVEAASLPVGWSENWNYQNIPLVLDYSGN